jgi:hypothetical protein
MRYGDEVTSAPTTYGTAWRKLKTCAYKWPVTFPRRYELTLHQTVEVKYLLELCNGPLYLLNMSTELALNIKLLWSSWSLAANPEVPGSILGATRFSE